MACLGGSDDILESLARSVREVVYDLIEGGVWTRRRDVLKMCLVAKVAVRDSIDPVIDLIRKR